MKSAREFLFCVLWLALLAGNAMTQASSAQQQTTFVQITDAHLFDDDESANFSALDWAITTINHLVSAGTNVDFVVYTGDLGLRNIAFLPGQCEVAPFESGSVTKINDPGIGHLAEELDRLTVRKLYLLPGNNDLAREQLGDMGRYQCFLSQLQERINQRAQERNPFKPLLVANLEPDSTHVAGGDPVTGIE